MHLNGDTAYITGVMIGDALCGKTKILQSFVKAKEDLAPTVMDFYEADMSYKGHKTKIILRDTSGVHDEYEQLRSKMYEGADVIFIAFSVGHPYTLENVEELWYPEVCRNCFKVPPVVLIGNMTDLRKPDNLSKIVQFQDGARISKKIKAEAYLECSAETNEGVEDIFINALKILYRKESKCIIM